MNKSILFIAWVFSLVLCMNACHHLTAEDAKISVMEGERNRIPVITQQLSDVDDITIDSMRMVVTSEPMMGYLYTTWKNGKSSVPIIVVVSDIHKSKEHKGYIEWQSDWGSANMAYFRQTY